MASIQNIIAQVSADLDISLTASEQVIRSVFLAVQGELIESGQARLPGIGKLVLQTRPPRTARNPRTGEAVQVPERTVVRLRVFPSSASQIDEAAKELREELKAGLTD